LTRRNNLGQVYQTEGKITYASKRKEALTPSPTGTKKKKREPGGQKGARKKDGRGRVKQTVGKRMREKSEAEKEGNNYWAKGPPEKRQRYVTSSPHRTQKTP